jgi:hypothetical protein
MLNFVSGFGATTGLNHSWIVATVKPEGASSWYSGVEERLQVL